MQRLDVAREFGVPVVLRGDVESKLLQIKVAASDRARRRRALEKDSGAQARVRARRIMKHRNLQRARQTSPPLEEQDPTNVDEDQDSPVSPFSQPSPDCHRRNSRRDSGAVVVGCL
eukprot:CAMPEP_0169326002 /NCGR_PEP_ID=MMETSP1017-20121227/11286_1 /TAXON_ID=342587 /ORGANISM="Karlodinium micrum, Strain CCMP2283" /LENGTH=115 /DNA_ID=CAMNT_0009420713 /DNA_START=331 /DNA_END=676 /DNA_ORIENTATION=+